MRILAIVPALLALNACTTVQPIVGPDGHENQLIQGCPTVEGCYDKAREVCGGNYKIVNSNSESGQYGTSYSLLVKCER